MRIQRREESKALNEALVAVGGGVSIPEGGGGNQGERRECKGERDEELTMYDKRVYRTCKEYRSLMARKEVDLREL